MKFIGFLDDSGGVSPSLQAVEKPSEQPAVPNSYKDPYWSDTAARAANEFGVPPELLQGILTKGERSNADQVSSAGARTPFQIIPTTRQAFKDKYGIDAYESPDSAARVAALHLRESFDRGATPEQAVREYHGGPDRSKWGPVNDAYAARVLGDTQPQRQVKSKPQILGFLDAENPYQVEQKQAQVDAPAEQGDMSRGAEIAWKQNKGLIGGSAGLAGAIGEKQFGEGGFFTGLKNWGLDLARKGDEDVEAVGQKPSDDITVAYDKAKEGDFGPLVDNIQYNIGYMGSQVAQSIGLAVMGAGIGEFVGGPPGAAAGGAAGAVATNLGKGLFSRFVGKEASRMAVKELGKDAAPEALALAAKGFMGTAQKRVAGAIGAGTAMQTYNLGMEAGQIYPMAVEQAKADGRDLTGPDLWKALAWSAGSAGSETATDVISIAALLGRIGIPGVGGRVAKALAAGGINAFVQGGQEGLQTWMEWRGAGKEPEGPEFAKDFINSAWGPVPFSFLTGLGTGAFHGGRKSTGAPVLGEDTANAPVTPANAPVTPANAPVTPANAPVDPKQRAQEIQAEAAQRIAQGQPIADLAEEARSLVPELASREQQAAAMESFKQDFQKTLMQASVLDSADQLKELAKNPDLSVKEKTTQGKSIKEAMLGAEDALRKMGAEIPEVDHSLLKLEFKPTLQDHMAAVAKIQASLAATLPTIKAVQPATNAEIRPAIPETESESPIRKVETPTLETVSPGVASGQEGGVPQSTPEDVDMRGKAWAIVKDGKVIRNGSLPTKEYSPKDEYTAQEYYKKLAEQSGGDLYIGGYPGASEDVTGDSSLIFGMTWDELKARQQKLGLVAPKNLKMPENAVLAYSAEKASPVEEAARSPKESAASPIVAPQITVKRAVDVPIKMKDGGIKRVSGWKAGDYVVHKSFYAKGYQVTHAPSSKRMGFDSLTKDQASEYAKRLAAMPETWNGVGKPPAEFMAAAKKVVAEFDPAEVSVQKKGIGGEKASQASEPKAPPTDMQRDAPGGRIDPVQTKQKQKPKAQPPASEPKAEVNQKYPARILLSDIRSGLERHNADVQESKSPQAEAPIGDKEQQREEKASQATQEVLDGPPGLVELGAKYGDLQKIQVSREGIVPGTTKRLSVYTTAHEAITDIDRQLNMARSLLQCLST